MARHDEESGPGKDMDAAKPIAMMAEGRPRTRPDILSVIFDEQLSAQRNGGDRTVFDAIEFLRLPEEARLLAGRTMKEGGQGELATKARAYFGTLMNHALPIQMEAGELINWAPWKHWSSSLGNKWDKEMGNSILSDEHMLEMSMEAIDILHFLVNVFIVLGLQPDDVLRLYLEKRGINAQRWATGGY